MAGTFGPRPDGPLVVAGLCWVWRSAPQRLVAARTSAEQHRLRPNIALLPERYGQSIDRISILFKGKSVDVKTGRYRLASVDSLRGRVLLEHADEMTA